MIFDKILEEEGIKKNNRNNIEFFNIEKIKIPKNMTIMLYGDGGLGKSWFLGDICGEIANKENICILYHNIDSNCSPSFMKAFELKSKSDNKLELNDSFKIDNKSSLGTVSLLHKMASQVKTKQIIYIIDTLDSAKNIYAKNINFNNTDTANDGILIEKFYSDLNVLRNELNKLEINISIILVHHTNKSNEISGSIKIQTGLPLIYKISKDDNNNARKIELVKNNGIIDKNINFTFQLKKNNKLEKSNVIILDNYNRFDPIINSDDNFELLPLNINLSQINSSIIDVSNLFNNLKIKINNFNEIPKTFINNEISILFLPTNFAKFYKTNKNQSFYKGEIVKSADKNFYVFEQLEENYETLTMMHKKILLAIFNNLIISKSNILKNYTAEIKYSEIAKYLNIKNYSASYYKTIEEYIYELSRKTYDFIIFNKDNEIVKTLTNFEFFKILEKNTKNNNTTKLLFSSTFIDLFLKDAVIDINKYGKIMTNIINDNIIFSIISFLFSKNKMNTTYSELIRILNIPKKNKNISKLKQNLKKEIFKNQEKVKNFDIKNIKHNYISEDSLFANLDGMEESLTLNAEKVFKTEEKEINTIIKTLKDKTLLEKLKYFGIELEYKEINKKQYEIIFKYERPEGVNFYNYKQDTIRRFTKSGKIY